MPDTSEFRFSPHHSALRCLCLVGQHIGIPIPPSLLTGTDEKDTAGSVLQIMRKVGLTSKVLRRKKWKNLINLGNAYPALAVRKDGYWVIAVGAVAGPDGATNIAVLDPLSEGDGVVPVPQEKFVETWSGTLILCKRRYLQIDQSRPFSLTWFMPEIMRYRRYFRDIAIAATMTNLIAIGMPMLFQIIIDKVITHHSYQTLFVVVLVYVVATLFDGLFGYFRQYMMLFATNKIDARLSSHVFDHLLKLPLAFFEHTTAGVLARNVLQTESVRGFLTGKLFQTMLDASALPVLLVVLTGYSGQLTLVVLLFSLGFAAVIGGMVPYFKHHLDKLYQAEGMRQAHLMETIYGMRTVKSLALEPMQKMLWDNKVATSVRRQATVGRISALGGTITHVLEKLMQITVLSLGAVAVFDGTLSLGTLVAFNMLSGRVTGPLVQMAGLINEYQQVALSVKMLGTVMNHPPERESHAHCIRPTITGDLEFEQVTYRYQGSTTPAIDRMSFRVEAEQMIGVVGRSGSGKSTVTRLIQGIYTAQEGMIRLNGTDIRNIDLAHLRKSIGVVLQDNFLFRGTVRENIAATRPDASLEEVMEAARIAGAEEFIERLPYSYETLLEESASNLSGGQRQRIAIARALLSRPQLLIFDEATSALDPDSEVIVQNNLNEIARNRTMIIVSHRLSSLVQSDKILVLEHGEVMDFAPHATLLERCPVYQHLWSQQTQHMRLAP